MISTIRFALNILRQSRVSRRSPAEVERLRERRLARLVRYAMAHSPYYRQRYAHVRVGELHLSDLPPVDKSELMAHFDDVVTDRAVRQEDVQAFMEQPTNLGKYFRGRYVLSHTSGTQGRPMMIVQDRRDLELLFALQFSRGNAGRRVSVTEGMRRLFNRVRLAVVTMRPGFFPSASAFTYFPKPAQRFVDLRHFSFDDAQLVENLNAFRPNAITAYAGLLTTLASKKAELKLAPDLIQITNISESLSERGRKQVQAAFNVPILDSYAMGECPFLSNGCPTHGGAHLNSDWAILEVVDDNYRPVGPGVPGTKVLLTNLANRVQPIIRYEIGDLVEMADQPCDCGNALPRIAHIGGRAAEALWIWDGTSHQRIALGVFKCACEYLHEIREWQVVQTDRAGIEVRIEPLPGAAIDRRQAAKILEERLTFFGLPACTTIEVRIVDRLKPDPATGKLRHLIGIDKRSMQPESERGRTVVHTL